MMESLRNGLAVLLLIATTPVAGEAQETPAADVPVVAPGLYASRQYVSNRALTRPAQRYIRVQTTNLVLHRVLMSDGGPVVESTYCRVEQEPLGRVRTELGPEFIAAMPTWIAPLETATAGDGTVEVRLPDRVMVLGADLEDPGRDALPKDGDDPRITDPDGDGNPGMTVEVSGFVSGQVYLVQRLVRGLTGELEPDGRITGNITGGGDQVVIGASNVILKSFTPTFEHNPDPKRNTFVWVPVSEDSTCESVIAESDALFGDD
ncbi:MAG: hypothetical protein M8866_03000 [marine benthic group bacterium]|nr:hypothetical protein [Candidatus Benthicola marisminoris]